MIAGRSRPLRSRIVWSVDRKQTFEDHVTEAAHHLSATRPDSAVADVSVYAGDRIIVASRRRVVLLCGHQIPPSKEGVSIARIIPAFRSSSLMKGGVVTGSRPL